MRKWRVVLTVLLSIGGPASLLLLVWGIGRLVYYFTEQSPNFWESLGTGSLYLLSFVGILVMGNILRILVWGLLRSWVEGVWEAVGYYLEEEKEEKM